MTETQRLQQPSESILEEYQRFCEGAYPAPVHTYLVEQASAFFRRSPAPADWVESLQDGIEPQSEGVLTFLALTGRLQVPFSDLVAGKLPLLELFRLGMPDLKAWFEGAARSLGYSKEFVKGKGLRCWLFWSALEGKPLMEVTAGGADHLRSAIRSYPFRSREERRWGTTVFGVSKILYHQGVLPVPPKRYVVGQLRIRESAPWKQVYPGVRATVERYLGQFATIRRPATVDTVQTGLTQFFRWLHGVHPEVTSVNLLERHHIEEWKVYLANRQGVKSGRLAAGTRKGLLGNLATFLRNISAWEWPEAPVRPLVFSNDYPVQDEPLPRFLPDDAAAALLKAAEASNDLFTRVAVTTLLRTGLRRGELIGLTVDCVVRIGNSDWLRVPVGKLHNDRYVPLHPDVRRCLDDWMAARGDQTWTNQMFVRRGEPIRCWAVGDAVQRAAMAAGLGRVTPHQLRHTLATQAVNRGMSLESIAAMLGHRSMEMTLVYARIANRTVEKEYFNVTRQLDQRTNIQVTIPEGPGMANLRKEMDWRRLGNGYCTRPKKMPCEYETICETCSMFLTTHEFLPTLQVQKEDAERKGQVGRVRIFCDLITKVEGA